MRIVWVFSVVLLLCGAAGCCMGGGDSSGVLPAIGAVVAPAAVVMPPEEVARAYLEAGARQDEPRVRELLDPQCHSDAAMLRVDAVRMMGAPMTLANVTVTPSEITATSANVAYTVDGSVHAEGGTTVTFGATVNTGRIDVDSASQSGTLRLANDGGGWHVICPLYAITPMG